MVACGAAQPAAQPPAEEPAKAEEAAAAQPAKTYKDLTVGFIQTGSEGGWRAANTASFKETAEQLGINLKFYDAQNKLENQVSAFHQFNQDKDVNVIILAALETTGWEEVLKEAKDNGKIVVLEDRRIDAPDDMYVTYIGSDFAERAQSRR
jgi:simple sugar transport system substrate-binding protein